MQTPIHRSAVEGQHNLGAVLEQAAANTGDTNETSDNVTPRKPTLGEIVLYRLATWDLVLQRNGLNHGDYAPAVVVRVYPNQVNLHVFSDGDVVTMVWKGSVTEGEHEGQYKFRD
jgi:hypothetical protein